MTFDDFSPYVLPFATSAPDQTMAQHARLAAIDFFRQTNAWRVDLSALTGNGVLTSFTMPATTDAAITKLLTVAVTPTGLAVQDAAILEAGDAAGRIRSGTLDLIAYTDDRKTLRVWPAQPVGASIVATVALKPTLAATTLPDALFEQYAQDIANGAIATLLSLAKEAWYDPVCSREHAAAFKARIATTTRARERGFATGGRRSKTRWF